MDGHWTKATTLRFLIIKGELDWAEHGPDCRI